MLTDNSLQRERTSRKEVSQMSKLIRACIAVAAFAAFAVLPATASAQNDATLQTHTGGAVAVGTSIAGTGAEPIVLTNANTEHILDCKKSAMHGTVTANSHTEVAATITSATLTECTSTFLGDITVTTNVGNGTPWCLRSSTVMATDEFQVRGNSCPNASRGITFVLHTAVGECAYERANGSPVRGTYTTNIAGPAADLHVTHQEFKKHNSNFFCPSAVYLDMHSQLEGTISKTDLKLINAT
jgi:hypothetical protein